MNNIECGCGRRLIPGPVYSPECDCGGLWSFGSSPAPPEPTPWTAPLWKDPVDPSLFWKREDLNPTGSFKDRGAHALAGWAQEYGATSLVADSSGSAALAAARQGAVLQLPTTVHAPESLGEQRKQTLRTFGARIVAAGSREDAARRAREQAADSFWFSHVYHPVFAWGVSLSAHEVLAEDQNRGEEVDWIVPVGNGSLLLGLCLALETVPRPGVRLVGVQAENCAGLFPQRIRTDTAAAGIGIASPPRRQQLWEALKSHEGTVELVSEEAMKEAEADLRSRGVFAEPASATVLAAFRRRENVGRPAVGWLTGAGGRG